MEMWEGKSVSRMAFGFTPTPEKEIECEEAGH
jgi:hypothetical protein